MQKCKFCNEKSSSKSHSTKCWLNPQNMKIVLELVAKQIIAKSSFGHIHYSINIKPIDIELRKLKMTSFRTILKRLNLDNVNGEMRLYAFIHFVVEKGLWDIDAFPPFLLYIIDAWHCFGRDEGQWRVDYALEIEDNLLFSSRNL